MSIEAMKQALEALEYLQGIVDTERGPKAAKALRQAIAEESSNAANAAATQEPVAWVCYGAVSNDIDFEQDDIDALPVGTMLYTRPQPKAEQEPKREPRELREWVGLTDDEMNEIWSDQKRTGESITRAIEAKLKEKNT